MKAETDDAVNLCYESGGLISVKREALVPASEAAAFFSDKLVGEPQDTFALNSRGWAYYLLGNLAKAVADFDEFLPPIPARSTTDSPEPRAAGGSREPRARARRTG